MRRILAIPLLLLAGCCRCPAPSTTPAPAPFKAHTASTVTLSVDQGATLSVVFSWFQSDGVTPVDLTSYTVTFHVLQTTGTLIDWTSYCTLGGTAGTITLTVPATVTATYTSSAPAGFGFYNLVLIAPDGVTKTRVWQGNVILNPSVGWLVLPREPWEGEEAWLAMAA